MHLIDLHTPTSYLGAELNSGPLGAWCPFWQFHDDSCYHFQ